MPEQEATGNMRLVLQAGVNNEEDDDEGEKRKPMIKMDNACARSVR